MRATKIGVVAVASIIIRASAEASAAHTIDIFLVIEKQARRVEEAGSSRVRRR